MEKPVRPKQKNKKPAEKPKTNKKKKSDGPTCSMFLADLSRKLASKKRQDTETKNVVQNIIEVITNALPIKFSRQSPPKKESPTKIETQQAISPELQIPNTLDILKPPQASQAEDEISMLEIETVKTGLKMPKMPLANSDIFKQALLKRKRLPTEDVAVNTGGDHDIANEITKYVGTLKKISLIAEEFNKKTAKNLKEIVDSVQEDLVKKLEEMQAARKAALSVEKPVQITESPDAMEE